MYNKHGIRILLILLSLTGVLMTNFSLPIFAQQTNNNPINFTIPKVVKDGKDDATKSNGTNVWKYENELTLDDAIKYGWSKTDLDLKYRDKPAKGGGYLKIYKDDDTIADNFLLDFGSSPLQINKFGDKLKEGDVKLIFQYLDFSNKVVSKYVFSFRFRNFTNAPQLNLLQPAATSVLARGIDQDFVIRLKNFSLETNNSNNKNRGKLNVYFNEVKNSNLIGTLNYSKDVGDGFVEVRFNSKDLNFEKAKIPDSSITKLFFVLTKTTGEILPYQTELILQTNYNNTLNVGWPKVTILEPRKDRTDLQFDGDKKFILQIDNFEILSERKDGGNESRKGYLQIFVDDVPRKTVFGQTQFSLNEIGLADSQESRKTIKVQLVNKDFTKLTPDATDSVDVIFVPRPGDQESDQTPQVENNNWRIVIVILTVVLVIGGIAVLITKG